MSILLKNLYPGPDKHVIFYCTAHGCHYSKPISVDWLQATYAPERKLYELPFTCPTHGRHKYKVIRHDNDTTPPR